MYGCKYGNILKEMSDKFLIIRASDTEKNELKALAEKLGFENMSDTVRALINRESMSKNQRFWKSPPALIENKTAPPERRELSIAERAQLARDAEDFRKQQELPNSWTFGNSGEYDDLAVLVQDMVSSRMAKSVKLVDIPDPQIQAIGEAVSLIIGHLETMPAYKT